MIEIDEQICEQWKRPPEGFNEDVEDGPDFETTRFGMNAIDRVIDYVGHKTTLPVLSRLVERMLL